MCDHQPVVGREGRRQKVPAQRAVEEPYFTLLGNNAFKKEKNIKTVKVNVSPCL